VAEYLDSSSPAILTLAVVSLLVVVFFLAGLALTGLDKLRRIPREAPSECSFCGTPVQSLERVVASTKAAICEPCTHGFSRSSESAERAAARGRCSFCGRSSLLNFSRVDRRVSICVSCVDECRAIFEDDAATDRPHPASP